MRHLIVCNCANARLIPEKVLSAVKDALSAAGVSFLDVPDLCGLAAARDPLLADLAGQDLVVAACHERAVRWLMHAGGGVGSGALSCVNIRCLSPDEAIEALDIPSGFGPIDKRQPIADEWQPWYPVIDYDRCINCGQCLNFCLFGVYETESERVTVKNPAKCKNNCPACARICPEVAIIFPKLEEGPLNGGEIADEELARANVKVNVDKLLGDDVYSALAERRKKRKRILLKQQREQAEKEREACVKKHGGQNSPGS